MLHLTHETIDDGPVIPPGYEYADRISFTYLHGQLQRDAGYDLHDTVKPVGEDDPPCPSEHVTPEHPGRIEPCRIWMPDGWRAAKVYLWRTTSEPTRVLGLVVQKGDEEAERYAFDRMCERLSWI